MRTQKLLALLVGFLWAMPLRAADIDWSNAASGTWDTATNWAGGSVPLAADNAFFNALSGPYGVALTTSQSINNVTISSANVNFFHTNNSTLTVGGIFNLNAGTYNLQSGTLTGSLTAAAGSMFNWTQGSLGGGGTVTLNGTTNASGTGTKNLLGTINVGGTFNWQAGSSPLQAASGSGVTITSGGLFDIQQDGTVFTSPGVGALTINSGTLRKSGGTLGITVPWTVTTNSGTIDLQAGGIGFTAGGTFNGTTNVTGTTVNRLGLLDQTFTVPSGSTLNIATRTDLESGNPTLSVLGTANLNGGLSWQVGTIGGTGTTTLGGTSTASGSGNKLLAGQVNISGTLSWTGGNSFAPTVAGAGFTINSDGTLDIQGMGTVFALSGGLLNNNGTFKVTSTSNSIGMPWTVNSNGGTFDTVAGSSIGLSSSGTFAGNTLLSGAGQFFLPSSGTITVPSGATLTSTTNLTHSGTGVLAVSGTANLNGTFNWQGGSLGGTGSTNLNGTTTISNATPKTLLGVVNIGGTATVTSTMTSNFVPSVAGTGLTITSGGVLDVQSSASNLFPSGPNAANLNVAGTFRRTVNTSPVLIPWAVTSNGGTFDTQTGVVALTGAATFNGNSNVTGAGQLQLGNSSFSATVSSGATLTVTSTGNLVVGNLGLNVIGTANVNGALVWVGGPLGGSGTTNLNGITTTPLAQVKSVAGMVNVGGTFTWTQGTIIPVTAGDGIAVTSSGTFNISANDTAFGNTIGVLTNAGTINASPTSTATIQWALSNSGTINVQSGILNATNSAVLNNTGTINLSANTVFSTSFLTTSGSGSVSGPASATAGISSMTFTGGTLIPGGLTTPGQIVTGDLTMNSSSTLNINVNGLAPITGHDQLVINGSVILGNATLAGNSTFAGSPGDIFVLVNNDQSDPVVGTFNGLPQGSIVTLGTNQFYISYFGDALAMSFLGGNDIVLTPVPEPTTMLLSATLPLLVLGVRRRLRQGTKV